MTRRHAIRLDDVASLDNLALAFWRAARGKRTRPAVQRFGSHLLPELNRLREGILSLTLPLGRYRRFQVFDPKPRVIHAPDFQERVLHHALMEKMGPTLDRALVDDSFACRPGKGTLAGVLRAQQHVRRFPWYVKVDVRSYFASIDHGILRARLRRRFKGPGVLALCDRIVDSYQTGRGKGLPIGALTSQHFANEYLSGLDRYLLQELKVAAMVRYMDDVVWWCHSRTQARDTLEAVTDYARSRLALTLRGDRRIQRSAQGVSFLGFRVFAGTLKMSRRRRVRYHGARTRWERAYLEGQVDGAGLQAGYAAALAVTAHAHSLGWRRRQLQRHPALDV